MKIHHIAMCSALLLLATSLACAKPADMYPGHELSERYEGHYPCTENLHPEKCDRIKVWLFLFTDARTGESSRYNFGYIIVGVSNERIQHEGMWRVDNADTSAHPGVPVITLDENTPLEFRHHLRIDDHLILLLDEEGRVRPGHPDGGFTLYNYTMQRVLEHHWP